jgi:hypothetical protein
MEIYTKKYEKLFKIMNIGIGEYDKLKEGGIEMEKYFMETGILQRHMNGSKLIYTDEKIKSLIENKEKKDFIVNNTENIEKKIMILRSIENESGINLYNIGEQVERYKEKVIIKENTMKYYKLIFNDRSKEMKYGTVEEISKIIYKSYNKIYGGKIIDKTRKYVKHNKKHYDAYELNKKELKEIYEIMKYRVNSKNIDKQFKDVFEIKNIEIEESDQFID